MPIYSNNILTRKAAVDGQFDNSGGRIHPTNYVVHHEVGGLLPKLTEVDHQGGRVDLAKCYLSIETVGAEQGDDCYTYLDQSPADPKVDCLIFRPVGVGVRSAHTDTRAVARSYIEAYQIQGGIAPWYVRGIHVAGMNRLELWSRVTVPLPEVGQTLYLVSGEGGGGAYSQYVQIKDFSWEIQTFLVDQQQGEITRRLMHLDLTSMLAQSYNGSEVSNIDPVSPVVRVRTCVVADSARYYGRASLASPTAIGDTTVNVGSGGVYGQLAPSARGETALASLAALASGSQLFASGGLNFTVSGPVHTGRQAVTTGNRRTTWTRTLTPIPASGGFARAHVRILDHWYTVTEGESGTVGTITVNRMTGATLLSLSALPDAGSWVIWEWPSAIHFTDRAGTTLVDPVAIIVDLASTPEPGSLVLTWTSGEVTKSATEASTGRLSGDGVGYRVGTKAVLYLTGNLPDGGTQIGYAYHPVEVVEEVLTPTMTGPDGTFTLSNPPMPASLSVIWSVERTVAAQSKSQSGSLFSSTATLGGSGSAPVPTIRVNATERSSGGKAMDTISIADDGAGHIGGGSGNPGGNGLVNYTTGVVSLRLLQGFTTEIYTVGTQTIADQTVETGTWTSTALAETLIGRVNVRYCLATVIPGELVTGVVDVPPLTIQLLRGVQDQIVPGTVRFTLGSKSYSDRDGTAGLLYWVDGSVVGSVDYLARLAKVTNWLGATTSVAVTSLISTFGQFTLKELSFRTSTAPIAAGSLELVATQEDGGAVSGTGDTDGAVTGVGIAAASSVEHDIGVVMVNFTEPVFPGTIKYSATAFTIIPLNPDIIGLDPVRLPPDGRVQKIRTGDYAVIYEDGYDTMANPAVAGHVYTLSHSKLAYAYLEDGAGEQVYTLPSGLSPSQLLQIPKAGRTGLLEYAVLEDAKQRPINGALYTADLTTWQITLPSTFSASGYDEPFLARFLPLVKAEDYDVDRDAGTLTTHNPFAITGYTQPLICRWRIHDLAMVAEAQTTGLITLVIGDEGLAHNYSTNGAISAMLLHGDLGARVANQFQQNTDSTTWLDYLAGSGPSSGAAYNFTDYPVLVANNGAVRERWRLRRRADASWDVIGETMGVIANWSGSTTLNAKRVSSQAHPYFTIYAEGLGGGWSTGNIIQFETYAAQGPLWVARTVKPSRPTVVTDSIRLRHRVGAD